MGNSFLRQISVGQRISLGVQRQGISGFGSRQRGETQRRIVEEENQEKEGRTIFVVPTTKSRPTLGRFDEKVPLEDDESADNQRRRERRYQHRQADIRLRRQRRRGGK